MNGDEQVGFVAPRNGRAFAMIDIYVAVANQNSFHALLGVDAGSELTGYRQRDVLFTRPRFADRTRIVTTVAWIYGDNDVAPRRVSLGRPLDGLQIARTLQIDNEPVSILAVRSRREAARTNILVEIQHDS